MLLFHTSTLVIKCSLLSISTQLWCAIRRIELIIHLSNELIRYEVTSHLMALIGFKSFQTPDHHNRTCP